jgi:hypothetical protein
MRKLLLIIPALLMVTGCLASNPFSPAKTTLNWVKTGLHFGAQGVTIYLNNKQKECAKKEPTNTYGAVYQDCMKTAYAVKKYFDPTKAIADKAIKAAEEGIADAEKKMLTEKACEKAHPDKKSKGYKDCVETYKAEVMKHVKNAGCVVLTALDGFLPAAVKAPLKMWINLLKGWACDSIAKAKPAPKVVLAISTIH